MFWILLITVPGIMFHLLPLTTITFCCTWTVLSICDANSLNKFGSYLTVMSIVTLLLFAVRCIIVLVSVS